jgi:predicted MFS family arabinose efflux permease
MFRRIASLYKDSFTGLSVNTWLLSLVVLINRSGTMVVPYMTLYLTSKGMNRSLSEAGFVISLFGLGSILGSFLGGRLSDKIGFYKIQLLTLLLGGLTFVLLGQIKSYPLICVCTFLLSLVNEGFRPANSSAIAHYSTAENRTRSFSLNRLAINLGWAVGASMGGLLAAWNYELIFWVDGGTNIAAAILLFFFLKPPKVSLPVAEKKVVDLKALPAHKDKIFLWFIFLATLFACCFFQLFTTVPKYYRDVMHLGERFIGLIMAINGGLIVLFEMVLIYSLDGKKSPLYYIRIGLVFCALAFFALLLPGPARWVAMLMIILITLGEMGSHPFLNAFWVSRATEKNRGQYASFYSISWGIAQTVGPYASARFADVAGFTALFISVGVCFLLTAFGFWVLGKYAYPVEK